ncbi:Hypothetical predicted protein [Paramuricea clavata]|uniref:Uncharacterized protein n=1 Tax=Paramuricea clavata TaxID=317549 RepID=A0A7D9IPP4_PARCT|nr:Hypothetical predicted protein [Paramuricea clavata]
MAKVNQVWKELNAKMTVKRTRNPSGYNKRQKGTASEQVYLVRFVVDLEQEDETEKFASGAFRDAFKGMPEGGASQKKWVIKKYNEKARNHNCNNTFFNS